MKKSLASRYKNGGLDKYYTKPEIASKLTDVLLSALKSQDLPPGFDLVIEPAAGNGSFLEPFQALGNPVVALDIAPEHPSIETQDFLTFRNEAPSVYAGNPPFGHASHLAIKFFNHAAANGAVVIAFVLPRTFRKVSVQNRLDRRFHLISDQDLPSNAFLFQGQEHDVPSIFQVWIRRNQERQPVAEELSFFLHRR